MSIMLPAPPRSEPGSLLRRAHRCHGSPRDSAVEPFRFGVDLGTSTCVLTCVDADGDPVYVQAVDCRALRDGVIVNFHDTVEAVNNLKAGAEELLGQPVTEAATAFPPGIEEGARRACAHVLEQAGILCRDLVDEVSAANRVLGICDGIIVDTGAGSTGIGVYKDGAAVELVDIAGGGYHLDLILAGALGVDVAEARMLKHADGGSHLNQLRPGIERVAERIRHVLVDFPQFPVHLVGGGLMIPGADEVVAAYLNASVTSYPHADLVTPLGLAYA